MIRRILSNVLLKIRPDAVYSKNEMSFIKLLIIQITKNVPRSAKVVLTGSMAKGTFLKSDRDIDIFVLFPVKTPRQKFEPSLKKIMKKSFSGLHYSLSYAEHPYARFHYEGRRIDLVPAYNIKNASERLSAVLHTKFVKGKISVSMRDDVLLLKQFLKSNLLYGAEIKIQGFSGYLCELLIIRHGSFLRLLRSASGWKLPVAFDLLNKPTPAVFKKFNSQFVFIDPTDSNRNVAAALSEENIRQFTALAKNFLKKPSENIFFRTPETINQKAIRLKKKFSVSLVTLPKPDVVDDVLWGQINSLISRLKQELSSFSPYGIFAAADDSSIRLLVATSIGKLPAKVEVCGPPLSMKSHLSKFKKAHTGARFMAKKGKIVAIEHQRQTRVEEQLKHVLGNILKNYSHLNYPVSKIKFHVL